MVYASRTIVNVVQWYIDPSIELLSMFETIASQASRAFRLEEGYTRVPLDAEKV
jgi:hypothetical protein